jgi:hypothetical protein
MKKLIAALGVVIAISSFARPSAAGGGVGWGEFTVRTGDADTVRISAIDKANVPVGVLIFDGYEPHHVCPGERASHFAYLKITLEVTAGYYSGCAHPVSTPTTGVVKLELSIGRRHWTKLVPYTTTGGISAFM